MSERIRATHLNVSVTDDEATTGRITFAGYAGGHVAVPDGSSISELTYWGATSPSGTLRPLFDKDGAAVVQTVTVPGQIQMPDAIFGAFEIALVGDAPGSVEVHLTS